MKSKGGYQLESGVDMGGSRETETSWKELEGVDGGETVKCFYFYYKHI